MSDKKYTLKTKDNECINSVECYSYEFALEYFSLIKKLDKRQLLEIYTIEKDENRDNR